MNIIEEKIINFIKKHKGEDIHLEDGGFAFEIDGLPYYLCSEGEKFEMYLEWHDGASFETKYLLEIYQDTKALLDEVNNWWEEVYKNLKK